MGNCANFSDGGYIQLPGLSSSFSQGLTLQAWIHPDSHRKHCRIFDLGRGKEADNIFLSEDEKSDDVRFGVYQGSKRGDLLILKGAFKTGTWTQITVTVDGSGTAKGYVNGKLAGSKSMKAPKAASGGIRTRCYVGKSNWKDDKSFDGRMAELRIWERVLADVEITATLRTPLVGDEQGLIGYWPLEDFGNRGAVDYGRGQRHGSATRGVLDAQSGTLPVTRTPAAVGVTRSLVTDYIPYTAFPSDRPLAGVTTSTDPAAQQALNVDAAGRYTRPGGQAAPDADTIVTCAVWDVTLRGPEGGCDVRMTFDRDVDLVTVTDGEMVLVPQRGGAALAWTLAEDATVRVRLPAATQLELPCATVSAGGGTTRLDFPSIGSLADVTSEELSTAKGDATPPLPDGTPDETKDAVTLYLRQVACAAPVPKYDKSGSAQVTSSGVQSASAEPAYSGAGAPAEVAASGSYTTSDFWDDPIGTIEGGINDAGGAIAKTANDVANGVGAAVEDVGKALEEGLAHLERQTTIAVKGSETLVLYTADAAKDLIKEASKATAQTTAAAIASSIGKAETLCVSSVNAAANVVEIVGEIAGSAFRLVVQGIEEAIAAMRSFIERVGMVFRDFIEWLASLFSWARFKDKTDTIHDWILTQLDNVADAILAAGDRADSALAQVATVFSNQAVLDARFGDVVPKPRKMPGSAELDFVVSHVCNALDVGISMRGTPAFPALALPAGPCAALGSAMFELPLDNIYKVRCGDVISPLAAVWQELVGGLAEAMQSAAAAGADLVTWLKDTLTTRIHIPFFTVIFEHVLFPGWQLTPLRLIALTAAIPAQLLGWSLGSLKHADLDADGDAATTRTSTSATTPASVQASAADAPAAQTSDGRKSASRDDDDYLQGVAIAALVLESCAVVVSAVENWYETRDQDTLENKKAIVRTGTLAMCGGALALGVTVCNICTATKLLKGVSRDLAISCLTFELLNGVSTFVTGSFIVANKDYPLAAAASQRDGGGVGMGFGAVSFTLGTAAAFTAYDAADGTKQGNAAAGMWATQAAMFLCDATGFFAERFIEDEKTRTYTVNTMAVGSGACALGGVGWGIAGVA